MKVIDLLNKIANGEEVPEKIKYNNIIYNWDIKGYLHYEDETYSERAFLEGYRTDMCLNDEVEIIEDTPKEDKKIKRILTNGESLYSEYIGEWLIHKERYTEYDELLMNKINEIIDKVNGE